MYAFLFVLFKSLFQVCTKASVEILIFETLYDVYVIHKVILNHYHVPVLARYMAVYHDCFAIFGTWDDGAMVCFDPPANFVARRAGDGARNNAREIFY